MRQSPTQVLRTDAESDVTCLEDPLVVNRYRLAQKRSRSRHIFSQPMTIDAIN